MGSSGGLITSAQILDGTIATADIAAGACTQSGSKGATTGITTTSPSYVSMPDDAAGTMAVTLATTGGPLLMGFTGTIANDVAGGVNALTFLVDGSPSLGDLMAYTVPAAFAYGNHTVVALVSGLSAASHTITMGWRVNSGTIHAYNRVLWVVELKR